MNLRQLNRILLQTSLLPVIALLVISGVLVWQILAAEKAVSRIQLADQNIASASLIGALLVDEESALRGYQTTGNEIFLQPYEFARAPLSDTFTELRSGIRTQGADERRIDELLAAHRHWLDTIAIPLIITVHTGGDTSGTGLNLRGKAQMDDMRKQLGLISADQRNRRTADVEQWQALVRRSLEAVVGLALASGLLLGAFTRSRFHLILSAFRTTLADLRRNIQATEASEMWLRTTLSSIGDGVVVSDTLGRVALLNPVAEQLTGCTQKQALHQPVEAVVRLASEDTREPLPSPASWPANGTDASRSPAPALLLRPDGTALHVDARGAPIVDRRGEQAGSVMVIRDVSEQRRTQSALLASEKQATAGRVAATIAHEIHNPLDSVVNLLYLLENGARSEEQAHFLSLARGELDRVSHISRAMLGMYRESKEPIALDLRTLLESVVLLLNHQLLHAGVTLHSHFEGDLTVRGFPVELRQVFANLLGNAIEASPRGGIIRLSAQESADGTSGVAGVSGVQVRVEDQGAGIDPAAAPHLFEPFFTTKGEMGTGLGLWISQGIVQKHGGAISFELSTETSAHGTIFTVFLPRLGPPSECSAADGDKAAPVSIG